MSFYKGFLHLYAVLILWCIILLGRFVGVSNAIGSSSIYPKTDAIYPNPFVLYPPIEAAEEPKPVFPQSPDKPPSIGGLTQPLRTYDPNAKLPEWDITPPVWPVKVNQYFKQHHSGIDLDCNKRDPIYAVETGTIIWAGWAGDYGRMVKISHLNGFQTLYAHNDELFIKNGQSVARGQIIASCGTSGRSSGFHSHFSIIFENQWLNPSKYLNFYEK